MSYPESNTAEDVSTAEGPVEIEVSRLKAIGLVAAVTLVFLVLQGIGVAMVSDISTNQLLSESAPVSEQSSASASIPTLLYFLLGTGVVLFLLRYGFEKAIEYMVALGIWSVGTTYGHIFLGESGAASLIPPLFGVAVAVSFVKHPTWYVLNTVGILWGGVALALGGLIFSPAPVIALLVLLLVYDAIAVYKTGHMNELAEGVSGLNIPALVIFPLSLPFSMPDSLEELADTPVFAMGLGDFVLPSLLVVSAAVFSPASTIEVGMLSLNAPAIGTSLGILGGVLALFTVYGDGPHAGLPPLNTGALAGYAVACLVVGVPLFPS